jgi:hypothetical protein
LPKTQTARLRRTKLWLEQPEKFKTFLAYDIRLLKEWAAQNNYRVVVRLNGTSDIPWEKHGIIQQFPDIQFYDYTKVSKRKNIPPNYHLTFSFSGKNLDECREALANGMLVAVPFLGPPPDKWLGYPVISGDDDDLRFLEDGPKIVALRAKGPLRNDPTSPFLGDNWNV